MKTVLLVITVAACAGCGNNLAGPAVAPLLSPPGGLSALSLDSAHVRLGWTAPPGASDTSFALQSVTLTDNVIYYAKIQGNTGEINYVRVHVHLIPGGAFGSRQVTIRFSLQKVPRLLFA